MPSTPVVVEQWLSLSRPALLEKVRQVVKRREVEVWAAVRGHSVLAAQVRGALSALKAEVRGTRDEGMWGMWIEQARQALGQTESAPAPQPAAAAEEPAREAESKEEPEPEITLAPEQPSRPKAASTVPPVMFQAPGS
ncbi:hypothetical protein [Kutzneria albida]|uniref:Uncharacterized protein n=1 Tax=Kutzneria albida DSM 43870 TaxID=1449976 RepID=W5WNM3_9PSEU|nr:hypothetical protein [Kutzneria albida]AHH99764.1 hypothetical protein KALB_6405 [Kutzneria albida DSM 43870]